MLARGGGAQARKVDFATQGGIHVTSLSSLPLPAHDPILVMNQNDHQSDPPRRQVKTTVKNSGNSTVDRLYELEKKAKENKIPLWGKGQFMPDCWCHVLLDDRGRPYHLAMRLLAEIIYRYQPRQETKSFRDGNLIQLVKNFRGETYQHNRGELAARWNVSKDSLSGALSFLSKEGLVLVRREDKNINCRGFRNMVYVEPMLDNVMKMTSAALEKVYKSHPDGETLINTESHDGGNVAPMTPATSSPSSCNVVPTTPPRRFLHASLSKRPSENPSDSGFSAAEPPSNPESKQQQQKALASPSAPPVVDGDSGDSWEAPPPKPSGENGRFGSPEEKISAVRYRIGLAYKTWYQESPDLPAKEFESLLLQIDQKLRWKSSYYLVVIQAGWLWANDAPKKNPDSTFIPAFYSKQCDKQLQCLFKKSREKRYFLDHLAAEIKKQAESEYDVDLENPTREAVEAWWEDELLQRGVIRDPDKFYDDGGREISDPLETTWVGIRIALERWVQHGPERKPEARWLDGVIERFKSQIAKPRRDIHPEDYEKAARIMNQKGLLSTGLSRQVLPGGE